jgi:hypothetical protein
MLRASKFIRLFGPFVVLSFCASAEPQETNRQPYPPSGTSPIASREVSDLENGNLLRVAASPSQIQDVLVSAPGILVELKRWVAREASDNGQIVRDDDLTDNAIFERLKSDVAFRSVATRLVQHYGYLRPAVNPASETGKEQDLLLRERVRRLVQIEALEDSESVKPPSVRTSETKAVPSRAVSNPQENTPQKEPPFNDSNDGQPLTPSPRIMQTGMNPAAPPYSGATDGNVSFQSVSDAINSTRDPAIYSNGSADSPGASPGELLREPRLAKERDLQSGNMLRRANPYADIPSLYDLYVQAPSSRLLKNLAKEQFLLSLA